MEEKKIDSNKQKLLEVLKILKENGELQKEEENWCLSEGLVIRIRNQENSDVIKRINELLRGMTKNDDMFGCAWDYEPDVLIEKKDGVFEGGYTQWWRRADGELFCADAIAKVTEEEFEQYYYNTIDIMELGKSIGMEEQEKTLPNGKVINSLVWDQENLKKAVNEVKGLSGEGKPVRITGAAPAWLVSALTHTVHPCPVSVYIPTKNKYVDIPQLTKGEPNPEGGIDFQVTEKGEAVLIEGEISHESRIYEEDDLSKVVVPEVPHGKEVYISGKLPNYLTVAIAEAYAHTNSSVSLNQPGIGYTCSITHTRSKSLGDLTKDPVGKEQMKEDLAAEKEGKNQEVK